MLKNIKGVYRSKNADMSNEIIVNSIRLVQGFFK